MPTIFAASMIVVPLLTDIFWSLNSKFYHCSLRPPFSELMPNLSHRRHLLASCTASSRLMPFSISRKSLPRSLAYLSFSSARPHGLLSMTLGSGMSISSSALILWSYPRYVSPHPWTGWRLYLTAVSHGADGTAVCRISACLRAGCAFRKYEPCDPSVPGSTPPTVRWDRRL